MKGVIKNCLKGVIERDQQILKIGNLNGEGIKILKINGNSER